jgi:membrane-bound lytic murein transglycosylase D
VFFRVAKKDSLLYASFDTMTNAEKEKASGHEGEIIPTQKPKPVESKPVIPKGAKIVYYIIKSGDTLWGIAQKYNTTDSKLQAWNQIGANIQPGQKIKIYME